jgi:hypothetical protein
MAHSRTRHNRTYKPIFVDIALGESAVVFPNEEDLEELYLDEPVKPTRQTKVRVIVISYVIIES